MTVHARILKARADAVKKNVIEVEEKMRKWLIATTMTKDPYATFVSIDPLKIKSWADALLKV